MKEILQWIGVILACILAIIGYILAILNYKSSKKNEVVELSLFKDIFASSGIAIVVIVIFVGISMFF